MTNHKFTFILFAALGCSLPSAYSSETIPAITLSKASQLDSRVNISLYASAEAHYTAPWNNLNAINDGISGTGMDLPNHQTWGSWFDSRPSTGWLTYEWSTDYKINKTSVYFWTDNGSSNAGDGVAMPSSWEIQYKDKSTSLWVPVTLTGESVYPSNRLGVNTVEFEPVEASALRLFMNASNNGNTNAALGVTEWEVYASVDSPVLTSSASRILLAEKKYLRSATINISGIGISEDVIIEKDDKLSAVTLSKTYMTAEDVLNGTELTFSFNPEKGTTGFGKVTLRSGDYTLDLDVIISKDSETFVESRGNFVYDPCLLTFDHLTLWENSPEIVCISEYPDIKSGATCVKFEGRSGIEMKGNLSLPKGDYKISGWIKSNGTFETGIYATNAVFSTSDPNAYSVNNNDIGFLIPDSKEKWQYFEYTFSVANSVAGGAWINNDRDKTSTLTFVDEWQIIYLNYPEEEESAGYSDYPIQPVSFTDVNVSDIFWKSRIEQNQTVTIPIALEKCYTTGRVDNFRKAAGLMEGYFSTENTFDDTDIYKIIEGISYSIQTTPNPELEAEMEDLIQLIGQAQEEDGYLFTPRTAGMPGNYHVWVGDKRWEKTPDLSHELYNCGHMFEAAVAHFEATGRNSFLDIAVKNADLLVKDFLEGGLNYEPGHQIVEMGLVKLYRVTGNEDYLSLAKYFLDLRGNKGVERKEYSQSHLPVILQEEAVGHAVRAAYMYTGMADVAALTGNSSYRNAINKIWENVVSRKFYINGGIGARHMGEAFGVDYELPNATAYCETCAAIGNIYWNYRLFLFNGESKYFDVIERSLYNGVISGISLDGNKFFYPNPLEADGKYNFNHGSAERQEWFGCSCCPSNLCRFTASVPGYVYAQKNDSLFVNLYMQNEANFEVNGEKFTLSQKTEYPWNGNVKIEIDTESKNNMNLLLRIPGWAKMQPVPGDLYSYINDIGNDITIKLNGIVIDYKIDNNGYVVLSRKWKKGDAVEIELPMPVQRTVTNEKVTTNAGKISLERGPILYCLEWPDNENSVLSTSLSDYSTVKADDYDAEFLNGVVTLSIDNSRIVNGKVENEKLKAIPYYAWANRGIGEMNVWLSRDSDNVISSLDITDLNGKEKPVDIYDISGMSVYKKVMLSSVYDKLPKGIYIINGKKIIK